MDKILYGFVDKLSHPKGSSHFDRTRDPPHKQEAYYGANNPVTYSFCNMSL
jgi:hypothetical protein